MGIFGGLKAATKGTIGGPLHLEAHAFDSIEASVEQAFEAGIRIAALPREVGKLALDLSHLEDIAESLRRGDSIYAAVDVSSLGKLSDVLMARLGNKSGASLYAPMKIAELSPQRILLGGAIEDLGRCSLGIALEEYESHTAAHVRLGVDITPLDIRTIAATQSNDLNDLLQESMDQFIVQYKDNIHTQLAVK